MIVGNDLYGHFEIEQILLELLNSLPVQRLKGIALFGVPDEYYHCRGYSRYDHSLGVMLILKRLGASLEEQVAGLLHDISILAFSHVADWVFSGGAKGIEDYHDRFHTVYLKKTNIPEILKKHGFSIEKIINIKNFTLLEREIPDLCADRIEYSCGQFTYWSNPKVVERCLRELVSFGGEIVFKDKEIANTYASEFLGLQTDYWGSYESLTRYMLLARALVLAIKRKIISQDDFWKDDNFILERLKKSHEKKITRILSQLEEKPLKSLPHRFRKKLVKKFRFVDPKVLVEGRLIRLSELDPVFSKKIEEHRKINEQGIII